MSPTRLLLFLAFFIGLFNVGLYATQDFGFKQDWTKQEYTEDKGFRSISVSNNHACGIGELGGVWCWGEGRAGQLGHGLFLSSASPVPVLDLPAPALEVATSANGTCAVLINYQTWCWGRNDYGQLDMPLTTAASAFPVRVSAPKGHTIARTSTGVCLGLVEKGAYCWGEQWSQDDEGRVFMSVPPSQDLIAQDLEFLQILGGDTHFCGVTRDGFGWCWGRGTYGQAGLEDENRIRGHVVNEPLLLSEEVILSLTTSATATCFVDTDKEQWCLGALTETAEISTPEDFIAKAQGTVDSGEIALGRYMQCHLDEGEPICKRGSKVYRPALPPGSLPVDKLVASGDNVCALDIGRSAWCASIMDELIYIDPIRPSAWQPDNSFATRWGRVVAYWAKSA